MTALLIGYARCSTDQQDLTVKSEVVLTPGTLFHPTNAAYASGRYGETGGDAMLSMWDSPSPVRSYPRRGTHHLAVPIDLQAEVPIQDRSPCRRSKR